MRQFCYWRIISTIAISGGMNKMKNRISTLWGAAIAMLVALGIVVALKTMEPSTAAIIETATLNPDCDLHQGECSLSLPDLGTVSLSITPRPIPVIKPIQVTVKTQGFEAKSITVDFNGVNMNMGINHYKMVQKAPDQFVAESLLPVCVRNSMSWQADIQVETDKGGYVFPFRFDTFTQQ